MLLCIEMSIFAVMHFFAFPYKEYSIKHHYSDPLAASGNGFSGETPKYKGGPLGIWAYLDAANPWDIIKASARGCRWLFVGRKHRHQDSSYQVPTKASQYSANPGDGASDVRPSNDTIASSVRRSDGEEGTDEEDRLNLLNYAQSNPAVRQDQPASSSPYRSQLNLYQQENNDEFSPGDEQGGLDLGISGGGHGHVRMPSLSSPPDFADTGYHGASMDHWAGVNRGDDESIRPPTYHTQDPRR